MAGEKPDISLGEMKTDTVLPQSNSVAELSPGMEVGQCRVIKLLGSGGMGQVYLVENIQMHKKYAMKILPQELSKDPTFIDRFRVEARVMADLDHPNIVHVQYIGEDTGRYFILMDYVEGPDNEPQTLEDRLKSEGKLQENDIVEILRQLCEALDYAHNSRDGGVIHRDLKPSNILMDKTGKPLVADFGLAKVTGDKYLKSMIEHSMRLTMPGNSPCYSPDVSIGDMKTVVEGKSTSPSSQQGTAGALIGTYEYMAPEQQDGKDASVQSDIYSLGMILYCCLIGKKPRGRWKLPSKLGLSPVWDPIIEKALEPEPEDRYESTMDLYRHLYEVYEQHIADEASKTSSDKQESPAPKKTGNKSFFKKLKTKSSHTKKLVATIILLALIVGGVIKVKSYRDNVHAKQIKEQIEEANRIDASALFKLGQKHGSGFVYSLFDAVKWYRKAADKGSADAMYQLCGIYKYGIGGVTKDNLEAKKWYYKAVKVYLNAAGKGDVNAMCKLGNIYKLGYGVPKDYIEAKKWYRKAAEKNHAWGMRKLANMYEYGYGVTKDNLEAEKWYCKAVKVYRKAAEKGDANAMFSLGVMYGSGAGVTKDELESVRWYRKAAEKNYTGAMRWLASMYKHGYGGVPKDNLEAKKWYRKEATVYRKAAEKGHTKAPYDLGEFYYHEGGLTQDYKEAVKWYKKTTGRYAPLALYKIGRCYYFTQDYKEAVKWYMKAAEQGGSMAEYELGVCWYFGHGVDKDKEEAEKWFSKAAKSGYKNVIEKVKTFHASQNIVSQRQRPGKY